jgi:hypothetical protein
MQPISFADFSPEHGHVVEWTVATDTQAAASSAPMDPIPPSYNQELHLQSARAAAAAGLPDNPWIGATFDVAGPVDLDALQTTFTNWLRRHEQLRSGFRLTPTGVERFTVPASEISLERSPHRNFTCPQQLHAFLNDRFSGGTDPFVWPPLVLGTVSRPASSTVFVAMDHVCGDGYSLALAIGELRNGYAAALQHREPDLHEIGSYLEHCAEERVRGEEIDPDDPALTRWRDFLRACGGTTPTFPLDLGVAPGQTWPQSMFNRRFLDAREAGAFEAACEQGGAGFFAGLLAAMGIAVRELTGQDELRTVTPVHTRHKSRWRHAMGWFVTCAPLEIPIGEARSFTEVLGRAQTAVRGAMRLSRYPAARIVQLLGDDFRVTRRDLFSMVSYTDYRPMSVPDGNPTTIGEVSVADDSHVWLSRTHDGLHIGIRHPDTPTAKEQLREYTDTIAAVLGRVITCGDYPVVPSGGKELCPGPL